MRILLLALLFFCASPAFAKNINVLRNFPLSPVGEGLYGITLFFEEANPGLPSENVYAYGCSLIVRSKGNFLLSARYKVNFEEESAPAGSERRWRKQYTNWSAGSDLRVNCKSSSRISDDYVRKVMAGYVRMER